MPTPKQFFYQVRGTIIGPVTGLELREAAFAGDVGLSTLVSNSPNGDWVQAARIRGLFDDNGKPLPHPGAGHFVKGNGLTPSVEQPRDVVATPGSTAQPKQFYFIHAGNVVGPMTEFDLRECARLGNVVPTTLVANDPNGEWLAASRIQGLFSEDGKSLPRPPKAEKRLTDAPDPSLDPPSTRTEMRWL